MPDSTITRRPLVGPPAQPLDVAWPTASWPTGAPPAGVDLEPLLEATFAGSLTGAGTS